MPIASSTTLKVEVGDAERFLMADPTAQARPTRRLVWTTAAAVLLGVFALLPWSKIEAVGWSYKGTPPSHAALLGRIVDIAVVGNGWLVVGAAGVLAASTGLIMSRAAS